MILALGLALTACYASPLIEPVSTATLAETPSPVTTTSSLPSDLPILDPFETKGAHMCWKRRVCEDAVHHKQCHFQTCPSAFPQPCGLGCSLTNVTCQQDVFSQVTTVAEVAFNIGQVIWSLVGGPAAEQAKPIVLADWAKKAAQGLVKSALFHIISSTAGEKLGTPDVEKIVTDIVTKVFGGQASEIDWTGADPTGVSKVIKTFWKPQCPVPDIVSLPPTIEITSTVSGIATATITPVSGNDMRVDAEQMPESHNIDSQLINFDYWED